MASPSVSGKTRKILMLTNSDHGQCNVFLATAHALLQLDQDVEVHFATFTGLEKSVASVSKHAQSSAPNAKPIVYHKINGLSMEDGIRDYMTRNNVKCKEGYFPQSFLTPLSFSTTKKALKDSIPIFVPYTGPQLVEIVSSISSIIQEVEAELVVVDGLMTAGLTALWQLDVKYMCLSPNTIKEFAAAAQKHGERFWKLPALFSGYPYPVPLHLIPFNIFFLFYMAYIFITDAHRKEAEKHLWEKTGMQLRTPLDLLRSRPDGLQIAVGFLPELDFPLIIPDHVKPCGLILRSAPPVTESDPTLATWLAKGPTVYINLGSICRIDENQTVEMATAMKALIDEYNKQSDPRPLQILWKLKKCGEFNVVENGSRVREILGGEIDAGHVRIVDWVVAEPISVLKSGHVVCSVHHGGANSFNEAVSTGVPHVVLPQWTDCYDFAERVEMLGIGKVGNKSTKPVWTAKELSQVVIEVTLSSKSHAYKQKAKELAQVCQDKGDGAVNAAKFLMQEINVSG